MRKITTLLLALVFAFGLVGCGGSDFAPLTSSVAPVPSSIKEYTATVDEWVALCRVVFELHDSYIQTSGECIDKRDTNTSLL